MASPSVSSLMKYRFLGNTGLLVSRFSFGSFVNFGTPEGEAQAYDMMVHAFKHGINFFDNAEAYGGGQAELVMGQVIKKGIQEGVWAREDLVLSTKIFYGTKLFSDGGGPNDVGLSRKHIIEGTKGSLKRFDLDYVDLIFCHRPDPYTPIEETVRAMNYVIEQGWALYWGTSEWSSHDIIEACEIADRLGLIRPVFEQCQYNILERSRVEYDFANLYKKYKYGLTTFSPVAYGLLTGKYAKGIEEGTRLAIPFFRAAQGDSLEDKIDKTEQLRVVADQLGCSLPQLALAWCSANENVSTVIIGASSLKQLTENLKALEVVDKITPEIRTKIDEIVQFKPQLVPQAEARVHEMRTRFI